MAKALKILLIKVTPFYFLHIPTEHAIYLYQLIEF